MKPLAVDLYCGLGGWTEGLLAEGYDVIGFDIERHVYGEHKYSAQLVIQDVLTLHGKQFREASLIVASPPCQAYSYMAMPWSRAKQMQREYEDGTRDRAKLTALFDACFRIQREACEASGRDIPLIVENVRGAQRWVGQARGKYGSYYLWGDVPPLMPMTKSMKVPMQSWSNHGKPGYVGTAFNGEARKLHGFRFDGSGKSFQSASVDSIKNQGGSWFRVSHNKVPHSRGDAIKQSGDWFSDSSPGSLRSYGSASSARKMASAMIAKIPFPLALHIARAFRP